MVSYCRYVAVSPITVAPSEAYARWQDRLATEFFAEKRNEPVVMFVDRDELNGLADHNEDGARSLASSVRELVDVDRGLSMFSCVVRLEAAWRDGPRTEPPPTLPVLALSVLAASEMRRDKEWARHNYYVRLAQALLPDGPDTAVETLRVNLGERGAFRAVAAMWKHLDAWLVEQTGAFGISTIRRDGENTRIGYPLSQTLMRRSDRAALTQFFAKLNFPQQGIPGPASLLEQLRMWVRQRSHGLTERFVQSLDDDALLKYLMPLVHDFAAAWDGKIITSEGLRRLEFRLAMEFNPSSAWWVIPSVPDFPGDILSGTCEGGAFEALITSDPYSSMYAAEGLPSVSSAALVSGMTARGADCVVEYLPSDVMILAENADAGGWMTVDAVQPYEKHVLVIAVDTAPSVESALEAAADSEWRRLPSKVAIKILGAGFVIYDNVRFSNSTKLDSALAKLPGRLARKLWSGTTARPRLINGLPLQQKLRRNLYLIGGEPDLILPTGAEPRDVTVTLDGVSDRVRASIFPFPLRVLGGGFTPGLHTIEADGEVLTFEVAAGSGDDRQQGSGSVAWLDGKIQAGMPGAEVCGALTPFRRVERPVLARRSSIESWLIHPSGQTAPLREPPRPSFAPQLNFPLFEVDREAAAWLAQKRARGWILTRMHMQTPEFCDLSIEDRLLWSELVASIDFDDSDWQQYCLEWERFRAQ